MNLEDIEKIIRMFENAKISSMDLEVENIKIKLEKNTSLETKVMVETPKETVVCEEPTLKPCKFVTSPLVGTFHASALVDAEPFVKVGDKVKKGDKLCIIEAMKVMNEITSPYDGIIEEVLVENNQMVEFDQRLFVIGEAHV